MDKTQQLDLFPSDLLLTKDTISLPSSEYTLRPLRRDDHTRGFTQLLSQLTQVGQVDEKLFEKTFDEMRHAGIYYITVIERGGQIVATTTLFVERKFIHSCAIRGRIEEVVVDETERGNGLAKTLMNVLIDLSRRLGCYKLSLDSNDSVGTFYEKLGFKKESNTMNLRF